MNYYTKIKEVLINNEINKRVKEYSKNKVELESYYNVGKMLYDAGKHYGEGIIKEYSIRLTKELGKGYNASSLKRMRQFYLLYKKIITPIQTFQKSATVSHQLEKWQTLAAKSITWSHYVELLKFDDTNTINYYINQVENRHLSVRELRKIIKE